MPFKLVQDIRLIITVLVLSFDRNEIRTDSRIIERVLVTERVQGTNYACDFRTVIFLAILAVSRNLKDFKVEIIASLINIISYDRAKPSRSRNPDERVPKRGVFRVTGRKRVFDNAIQHGKRKTIDDWSVNNTYSQISSLSNSIIFSIAMSRCFLFLTASLIVVTYRSIDDRCAIFTFFDVSRLR